MTALRHSRTLLSKCHHFHPHRPTIPHVFGTKLFASGLKSNYTTGNDSVADYFLQILEMEVQRKDAPLSHAAKRDIIKRSISQIHEKFPHEAQSIHFTAPQRERFVSLIQSGAAARQGDAADKKASAFTTRHYVGLINRYMLDRQLSSDITQEKKDKLREWMRANGNKTPSMREKNQLMTQLGLSRTQLRQQMRFLKEESGVVTEDVKDTVFKWLQEHDFRSPTSEERDDLQSMTRLSRNQLNNLVFRIIEEPGEISDAVRDVLRKWLQENNHRMPMPAERDVLQQETGLNKPQLYAQIANILKNTPRIGLHDSEQSMSTLREWFNKHKRQPTPEERQMLERQTQFTPRQIYEQVRRWSEEKITITPEIRFQILEYLQKMDFASPSSAQRDDLQQLTGLGRAQLNAQITNLSKRARGNK